MVRGSGRERTGCLSAPGAGASCAPRACGFLRIRQLASPGPSSRVLRCPQWRRRSNPSKKRRLLSISASWRAVPVEYMLLVGAEPPARRAVPMASWGRDSEPARYTMTGASATPPPPPPRAGRRWLHRAPGPLHTVRAARNGAQAGHRGSGRGPRRWWTTYSPVMRSLPSARSWRPRRPGSSWSAPAGARSLSRRRSPYVWRPETPLRGSLERTTGGRVPPLTGAPCSTNSTSDRMGRASQGRGCRRSQGTHAAAWRGAWGNARTQFLPACLAA
jgi:hypothetical protein